MSFGHKSIGRRSNRKRPTAAHAISGPVGVSQAKTEVYALPVLRRDGTIDAASLSKDIKQILQQAGIKKKDLKNRETCKFVMDFLTQRLATQRMMQQTMASKLTISHGAAGGGGGVGARPEAPRVPPRQKPTLPPVTTRARGETTAGVAFCWACDAQNSLVYSHCKGCGEAPLGAGGTNYDDYEDEEYGEGAEEQWAYVDEGELQEGGDYIWDDELGVYYYYVDEAPAPAPAPAPTPVPAPKPNPKPNPKPKPAAVLPPKVPPRRNSPTLPADAETPFEAPQRKKTLTLPAGALTPPPAPKSKAPAPPPRKRKPPVTPPRSPRVAAPSIPSPMPPRPKGPGSKAPMPPKRAPRGRAPAPPPVRKSGVGRGTGRGKLNVEDLLQYEEEDSEEEEPVVRPAPVVPAAVKPAPPPDPKFLPPPPSALPPPVLPHEVAARLMTRQASAPAAVGAAAPPPPPAPPPAPAPGEAPVVIALPRPRAHSGARAAPPSNDILSQIKMKRRSQLRAVVMDKKLARMSMEDKGGLANALMSALNARRLAVVDKEGQREDSSEEDDWSE